MEKNSLMVTVLSILDMIFGRKTSLVNLLFIELNQDDLIGKEHQEFCVII